MPGAHHLDDDDRMASNGSGTATSGDGRRFTLTPPPTLHLAVGDLVVLEPDDGADPLLGQVVELEPPITGVRDRTLGGVLVGSVDPAGPLRLDGGRPFAEAVVGPASSDQLEELQRLSGAGIPIGTWASGEVTVPARMRAQGFGRHTFLCGQSGSGKTYALGVILEQLLLHTEMRMVVLDPNADFVHLGEMLPDVDPAAAGRLGDLDLRVLRAGDDSAEALRARFATMSRQAQAAVLRLDPLADRTEYNAFLHLMEELPTMDIGGITVRLREGDADARALGQRIENLGVLEWEAWAQHRPSAAETMADARATVMDLSGFGDPQEPLAVALDVVETLWDQRRSRNPTLIVIDEAHNLCPTDPSSPTQALIVERLVQIAAEGRKYGLWLLLSSQRPSKVHPQALSQCDNLVLMRMNSPGDLDELARMYGFAPPAMLRTSQFFAQGEALVAGTFVPRPGLVRMGARLTREGGSDVRVPVRQETAVL
jgi:DNA helicase HerA-like ATPase